MTKKTDAQNARDRRRDPRVPIKLVIQYRNLEQFCEDYAHNVSLGGIFIETRRPLPQGSAIQLSFSLPGYEGVIQTNGIVVRVDDLKEARLNGTNPGMAIQFDDLAEDQKAIIDTLVQESLQLS